MSSRTPSGISPDRMIYFVLCSYGRHGEAWAERDIGRTNKADTIEDIRSGELPNIVQIIELNVVEFSSRDVTEDILGEVSFSKAMDSISELLTGQNAVEWRNDHARGLREGV